MAFSLPAGLCGSCSPFSLCPFPPGCSFSFSGRFCSPHISSPVLPVLQFVGACIKPDQRLPWDKVTLKAAQKGTEKGTQKGKVKRKVISYINLDPNKDTCWYLKLLHGHNLVGSKKCPALHPHLEIVLRLNFPDIAL